MDVDQLQPIVVGLFVSLFNLLRQHSDNLIAAFVLLLGYRLMKAGILRDGASGGPIVIPAFLARVAPGAALSLVGIAFLFDRGPLSLLLCLLIVTTIVGACFALLGYQLFLAGMGMTDGHPASVGHGRALFFSVAPGSLFALSGLAMVTFALWQGPSIAREYQSARLQANEQVTTVVDHRLTRLIEDVRAYVGTPRPPVAVQSKSGSRPPDNVR